ncbi:MAG: type II secretion system protein [Patescibacteria group bacterium]
MQKSNSGFLLIEVLVSTMIVSIALIFLLQAFHYSHKALVKASVYFKDLNLTEEKNILITLNNER